MLAIERSERASITTGKNVSMNVAEGDPFNSFGYWGRLQRRLDALRHRGCLPLHSLRSFL